MTFRLIATAAVLAAAVLAGCSSGSSSSRTSTFAKLEPPAQVAVPSVRGEALPDAIASLKKARLHWRVQRRYAGPSAGSVIDTSPGAGANVAPGTEVALVVSRGPAPQPAAAPAPPATTSSPAPAPPHSSNGGTPPVNSPQGQRALQNSPDCQHAPPPPPGYKGPVQC